MSKRLAVVLGLALALAGCKDNYGACEKAALDIGNGVTAGMKTVDQLRVSGLINVQEESNVLGYLKFINDADAAFGTCAQNAHLAGSKAGAYTACANVFTSTLNNPAELALIHVNNPQAQQNIQVIVEGVNTGINAVLAALGGA
jgi:hypothetical protein